MTAPARPGPSAAERLEQAGRQRAEERAAAAEDATGPAEELDGQAATGELDDDGQAPDDGQDDGDDNDGRLRRLQAEAATRRRELRDAQAEVTSLREQLAARDEELLGIRLTAAVEEHAAPLLTDVRDLLSLRDRAELLDDDGQPDAGRILAATHALLEDRPHLKRRRFGGGGDGGARGDGEPTRPGRSFSDVLRGQPPARRR